ncbi:MAG: acylphosphatase [Dehalococcoidia bacterium]|nr:acylphosphatase [Dehalococcoidia bacterium]
MRGSPLKVDARARLHIEVKGIVQGVGFRPFVYRLARNCHLNGWVRNTSGNVAIEVEGLEGNLSQFLSLLKEKAPHAARVQDVTTRKLPDEDDVDFVIRKSQPEAGKYQPVSPDLATCKSCAHRIAQDSRTEKSDERPKNRKYRYHRNFRPYWNHAGGRAPC